MSIKDKAEREFNKLESCMNKFRKVVDENKNGREACFYGSDDVLLGRNLIAFLEELLRKSKKLIVKRLDIEKELKENEKLSKELLVEKIREEFEKNIEMSKLTKEEREKIEKQLDNEKIQDICHKIVESKEKEYDDIIKKEQEEGLKNGLSKEDINKNIKDKLEENELRPNNILKATEAKEHTTQTAQQQTQKETNQQITRQVMRQ